MTTSDTELPEKYLFSFILILILDKISVSDLDGTNSKTLVNMTEGEVSQGLVVDPEKG